MTWTDIISGGFTEPQATLLGVQIAQAYDGTDCLILGSFSPGLPGRGASCLVGTLGVELCIYGKVLCTKQSVAQGIYNA